MNGNDRHDDSPRRTRRPDPLTDPLTDPWPARGTVGERLGEPQRSDHGGRGYRDERGVGHRRRAVPPPDGGRPRERVPSAGTLGPGAGDPPGEERPRGRRRRPGPADTGAFPVPPPGYEALQERPRGRRRKPESEDTPLTPYNGFDATGRTARQDLPRASGSRTVERPPAADPLANTPYEAPSVYAEPPDRARPSTHAAPPVPAPERASTHQDRGPGSRRQSREEPVEEHPARSRRSHDPDSEDSGAFALPFDEAEEDEEERPRRARRAPERGGGRRSGSRRAGGKRKRKRRKSKAALIGALLVLALLVGGTGVGGYTLLRAYVIPPDYSGQGTGQIEVVIEAGDSGTVIAQKLEAAGVVASVRAFTNEIRFSEVNFTPGTYLLRERMSAEAAIELLLDPATRVGVRVMIREGLRASTILEQLAEQTEIPLEEFQKAYADTEALDLPDYATQGPEGYLYPDTYDFGLEASAADMLKQMVAQYKRVASELELEKRAAKLGLDPNEIMAIAAIVEAETGSVQDMGKISQVVYNRLEIDMALGMDSTCFYVLEEYGIALNSSQLQRCKDSDSEYKTYYRTGLPIGPIVSPGRDAISAALEPEEGEWLFFVATDPENGVTEFAETEAEFLELVEKFNSSQRN